MKKITAILAATLVGATIAGAEKLSISSTFAWESDYVFRGEQLAEEYFAPSVDISYGGLYGGIWAALPVDSEFPNEVDFYAGYGFGLNETVSADVGFTYYTYPDLGDDFFDGDVNTFEIYGGVSFETQLSPAVYAFYDFDTEQFTLEGSVGHSVEVSEEGSVDFSAHLGYADRDGYDWTYYGAGVAYSYALAENASFSIGLNWYGSSEDSIGLSPNDMDDNTLSVATSFTAGF